MHKQIVRLGLALSILVGLFYLSFLPGKSGAVDAPDLISATQLDVQKSPDIASLPSSLVGIDVPASVSSVVLVLLSASGRSLLVNFAKVR